jgi:predicted transposase YbfD/YdcC
MLSSFIKHFEDVKDPRVNVHNQFHNLDDILLLTVLAVICGANAWTEIEEFGNAKREWLKGILELPNGIPSHDTFGRVFSLLDAVELQKGFLSWVNSLVESSEGEFIAIDGKTLRRSYDNGGNKGAIHMVSAWAVKNQLVFGQLKTEEKSNEITAIPALLDKLNLKNCTVSIDAMGCQTTIANKIVDDGGDYVLSVKGNQGNLHEQIEDFFLTSQRFEFADVEYEHHVEIEKDHGRIEQRDYWLVPLPEYFEDTSRWKGLKGIGCVRRQREIAEEKSEEMAYYILSFGNDVNRFATSARGHWGIENTLHWSLDVSFNEDQCRIRQGNAAENLAVIRHIALNLLKKEKTLKVGIASKRKKAGWDNRYLEKILASATT